MLMHPMQKSFKATDEHVVVRNNIAPAELFQLCPVQLHNSSACTTELVQMLVDMVTNEGSPQTFSAIIARA